MDGQRTGSILPQRRRAGSSLSFASNVALISNKPWNRACRQRGGTLLISASESPTTGTPTKTDAQLARESVPVLARLLGSKRKRKDLRLQIQQSGRPEETMTIPMATVRLLKDILEEMAKGNGVALLSLNA